MNTVVIDFATPRRTLSGVLGAPTAPRREARPRPPRGPLTRGRQRWTLQGCRGWILCAYVGLTFGFFRTSSGVASRGGDPFLVENGTVTCAEKLSVTAPPPPAPTGVHALSAPRHRGDLPLANSCAAQGWKTLQYSHAILACGLGLSPHVGLRRCTPRPPGSPAERRQG